MDHSVFEPRGRAGHDYTDFLRDAERAWLINLSVDQWPHPIHRIAAADLAGERGFTETVATSYATPRSVYTFDISLMTRAGPQSREPPRFSALRP